MWIRLKNEFNYIPILYSRIICYVMLMMGYLYIVYIPNTIYKYTYRYRGTHIGNNNCRIAKI